MDVGRSVGVERAVDAGNTGDAGHTEDVEHAVDAGGLWMLDTLETLDML